MARGQPQAPASRPPQVDGMFVDLDYLSALTCTKPGSEPILEWCCSDAGIAELRNWFNATGSEGLKETHLITVMRRCCPDTDDGRVLDIFDLLDLDSRGFIRFPELHLLVCILAGRGEGRMRQFLYMRGKDSFTLLTADSSSNPSSSLSSSDKVTSRKVKVGRLFRFLTAFGFDQYTTAKLNDLQLSSKQQLTESEVSLFLFAICQQHDVDFSGVGADESMPGGTEADVPDAVVSGDVAGDSSLSASASVKSKLCVVS